MAAGYAFGALTRSDRFRRVSLVTSCTSRSSTSWLVTALIVVALYFLCRWYARVKAERPRAG